MRASAAPEPVCCRKSWGAGSDGQRRRGEAGYNMVVLIVAVAVLNILVATMLPLWSTAIRREKEEELIFRGFQYAEAIRVYRQRHQGSYPNRLEDLIEVKPRCIRQLWKDPMTEDGKWGLIFLNQPGPPLRRQPPPQGQGRGGLTTDDSDDDGDDDDGRPQFGPRKGDVVQVGPIIGVHSKSGEESFLVFFGKERYDEWQFTESMIPTAGQRQPFQGNPAIGNPGPGALSIDLSTRWLGRPMRFLDQLPGAQPQDGTLPDGRRRQRGNRNPNANLP